MTVPAAGSGELTDVAPEGAVELSALAERLRLSMIRLGRQLRRRDPSELTIAQVSGLASVVFRGPLSVGGLAEIEGLPSPAATRLADKLETAGLVVRQANPDDRRGVRIVATEAGAELLARRGRLGNAWLAERLAALSESDRGAIERAVGVLESLTAELLVAEPERESNSNRTDEVWE